MMAGKQEVVIFVQSLDKREIERAIDSFTIRRLEAERDEARAWAQIYQGERDDARDWARKMKLERDEAREELRAFVDVEPFAHPNCRCRNEPR